MSSSLLASSLWAEAHNQPCKGARECHWCGCPCDQSTPHDDLPRWPGVRRGDQPARRSGSAWICSGCKLYRRESLTVFFLDRSYLDKKTWGDHSWLLIRQGPRGVRENDFELLRKFLLTPTLEFSLSLKREANKNLIQCCPLNRHEEIKADTELFYSLDNKPYPYTVYELEACVRNGPEGKSPGTRLLFGFLGPWRAEEEEKPKREGGRPKMQDHERPDALKRTVRSKK